MYGVKLYADLPVRRTRQILADLSVLAWVVLWAYLGRFVHDATQTLAAPGRTLESAGNGFRDKMNGAGDAVDDLPVLHDRIASPFRSVSGVGDQIESAGTELVHAVDRLASVLGWTIALIPIVLVVGLWLALRIRFVRRASAAQRFVDSAADLDLFALRAIARQPMPRLAAVSDDPGGAWRRGDPDVIQRLAVLELRDCGLRPPVRVSTPSEGEKRSR